MTKKKTVTKIFFNKGKKSCKITFYQHSVTYVARGKAQLQSYSVNGVLYWLIPDI